MAHQENQLLGNHLLASGCSFTCPSYSYIHHLGYSHVTNHAQPSAGNKYIADSIICRLAEHDHYDLVLVMWSGLDRVDFVTPVADSVSTDFKGTAGTEHYLFSLGGVITDWPEKLRKDIFEHCYKYQDSQQHYHNSLLEIIKTQAVLKSLNKRYYFMSYVNYWEDDKKPELFNGSVTQFPELNYLVDQIDFSKFIFWQGKDGLFEFATSKNMCISKYDLHPNEQAHLLWADLVRERILKDNALAEHS